MDFDCVGIVDILGVTLFNRRGYDVDRFSAGRRICAKVWSVELCRDARRRMSCDVRRCYDVDRCFIIFVMVR